MFGRGQMTVLFKVSGVQGQQCSRSAVFKVSSVQGQQSARERGGELTFAAGGQPPSCRPGCPHTRPGPGQTAAPSREPATHAAQHPNRCRYKTWFDT